VSYAELVLKVLHHKYGTQERIYISYRSSPARHLYTVFCPLCINLTQNIKHIPAPPCVSATYLFMALQPLWTLAAFFQSLNLYTVGRTPWTGDQPVARPLPTHTTKQTQNKRIQTSMPAVGFEPTIPMFELVKTVYTLDRVATVIGHLSNYVMNFSKGCCCHSGCDTVYSCTCL
jgi:hypothetical protein